MDKSYFLSLRCKNKQKEENDLKKKEILAY